MPVTQKHIADHLGIARSVVAEALNGHPRIAEHTRERVRKAARELGYDQSANREARALIGRRYNRRAKSGIVAVLSPVAGGPFTEEMAAYYRPLMDGASTAAHEHELSLLLCSHTAHSVPRVVVDGTVDGIIILGVSDTIREKLAPLTVPVVSVGIAKISPTASLLKPDERDGGRQAARHLLGLGHRRIAFLGPYADIPDNVPRLVGLREAMREEGVDVDPLAIETSLFSPTLENTDAALGRLMQRTRDFTALFCHNDKIAMEATRALRARGLDVPRDISIVGFDDTTSVIGFVPAITSIQTPRLDMGRRAVEIIASGPEAPSVEEQFPVHLIVRESTRAITL